MRNVTSIHIRVSPETKDKWLEICQVMEGKTQSKVFRRIIDKFSNNLKELFTIENNEK
jgi:predicted DNA-binding protein